MLLHEGSCEAEAWEPPKELCYYVMQVNEAPPSETEDEYEYEYEDYASDTTPTGGNSGGGGGSGGGVSTLRPVRP